MTYTIKILRKPEIINLKSGLYKLNGDLKVEINSKQFNKRLVIVPNGFVTDLASIPYPFSWVYSPSNQMSQFPAILHDYMYTGCSLFSRSQADSIFYDFLREQGFNFIRANLYYTAVHLFGFFHWNTCKKAV